MRDKNLGQLLSPLISTRQSATMLNAGILCTRLITAYFRALKVIYNFLKEL
jgi:hypothetical protein